MTAVSQAAFAKLKGVSRAAVSQWKTQGRLVFSGKLIDVEATQASLLNGASFKSTGQSAALNMVTSLTAPAHSAFEGVAGQDAAIAYKTSIASAALITAELLVPHLPESAVRQIIGELHTQMNAGLVEVMDHEFEPPDGLASWHDHPSFHELPMSEADWIDVLRECGPKTQVQSDV